MFTMSFWSFFHFLSNRLFWIDKNWIWNCEGDDFFIAIIPPPLTTSLTQSETIYLSNSLSEERTKSLHLKSSKKAREKKQPPPPLKRYLTTLHRLIQSGFNHHFPLHVKMEKVVKSLKMTIAWNTSINRIQWAQTFYTCVVTYSLLSET